MKKKLTLVVTCIVLVAAMVIGGTLAYFTDTKTAENTFTVGDVKIKLDGLFLAKMASALKRALRTPTLLRALLTERTPLSPTLARMMPMFASLSPLRTA